MTRRDNTRAARIKRHARLRKNLRGEQNRPRLCVFRSLKHIHAQLIDDTLGHTIVAASSLDSEVKTEAGGKTKTSVAQEVGLLVANRAKSKSECAVPPTFVTTARRGGSASSASSAGAGTAASRPATPSRIAGQRVPRRTANDLSVLVMGAAPVIPGSPPTGLARSGPHTGRADCAHQGGPDW